MISALELFRSAAGKKTQERYKVAQEIWKILIDEQYSIGLKNIHCTGVKHVPEVPGVVPVFPSCNVHSGRSFISDQPKSFEIVGRDRLLEPLDAVILRIHLRPIERLRAREGTVRIDVQLGGRFEHPFGQR